MTPADLQFALSKGPKIAEYAIANLRSLLGPGAMPHLDRASAPAVLICGAGPTLDLGRVKAAHDAGVSIWTVNNAARAVCSVVAPDVVVIRESLDVSDHLDGLAHYPKLVAVDLHACPAVWAKALANGPAAFFVPATVQAFKLAADLDVAPLYGGTASLTAAVALAAAGGAEWIGLEGVDLAYARDGQGYAAGARYAATMDHATGQLSGGVEQRELAERSGQAPPPMRPNTTLVHARDGGEHLSASGPWLDQIAWLEDLAKRRPSGVQSESCHAYLSRGLGLADLVGWPAECPETIREFEAIRRFAIADSDARVYGPDHSISAGARTIGPARITAILADIDRQVECQRKINEAVLAGADPTEIPDLIEGSMVCDVHSAGRRELAVRAPGDDVSRMRALYREYGVSVERLRSGA